MHLSAGAASSAAAQVSAWRPATERELAAAVLATAEKAAGDSLDRVHIDDVQSAAHGLVAKCKLGAFDKLEKADWQGKLKGVSVSFLDLFNTVQSAGGSVKVRTYLGSHAGPVMQARRSSDLYAHTPQLASLRTGQLARAI